MYINKINNVNIAATKSEMSYNNNNIIVLLFVICRGSENNQMIYNNIMSTILVNYVQLVLINCAIHIMRFIFT